MLYFYLKMHQNVFDGRAPPGPAGRAYNAPPDLQAGLKGRGGRDGKRKEGRKGEGLPNITKGVDAPGDIHMKQLEVEGACAPLPRSWRRQYCRALNTALLCFFV